MSSKVIVGLAGATIVVALVLMQKLDLQLEKDRLLKTMPVRAYVKPAIVQRDEAGVRAQ